MFVLDLQISQYIFAWTRVLPEWLVIFLATGLIWILFAFVILRAFKLPGKKAGILFLFKAGLAGFIGLGLNALIGYFYFRVRPFAALGFDALISKSALEKSFPSDHATVAAALAMVLFLHHKKSGYFGVVAALLIALGRILAGVHYVSDVLVGLGFGLTVGFLVVKIFASSREWFGRAP